ncbi:MAG: MoxR family ATPase [Lachnospiraceae bacterium]|jgi:MoxR-like ATPase|nr:MoxR family ATPase [Lachnospiraceae bacterium]
MDGTAAAAKTAEKIAENVKKVIVGKDGVIELALTAMLCGGHVLIEDMPGSGKTMLVKAIARSFDVKFSRIQMTPDLLPSDVTGLDVFDQKSADFVFHPGPVFTNLLLADEINRATPRTQASLLECMEEGQVTVDGVTRRLEAPFHVFATQNPVETAGTFPLPEAQLDRFLMKLSMGPTGQEQEREILERCGRGNPLDTLMPVAGAADLEAMCSLVPDIYFHPELLDYLQAICGGTRRDPRLRAGVSVRGVLAYMTAAKAHALLLGRDYVVPEDLKLLAIPVLAHRLIPENGFAASSESASVIEELLSKTTLPTEDWSGK